MKKIEIATSATVFSDVSELSSEDKMLMDKAVEARMKAYAPYSKFNVGAALLLENNESIHNGFKNLHSHNCILLFVVIQEH